VQNRRSRPCAETGKDQLSALQPMSGPTRAPAEDAGQQACPCWLGHPGATRRRCPRPSAQARAPREIRSTGRARTGAGASTSLPAPRVMLPAEERLRQALGPGRRLLHGGTRAGRSPDDAARLGFRLLVSGCHDRARRPRRRMPRRARRGWLRGSQPGRSDPPGSASGRRPRSRALPVRGQLQTTCPRTTNTEA
jgi:hypothetical protein